MDHGYQEVNWVQKLKIWNTNLMMGVCGKAVAFLLIQIMNVQKWAEVKCVNIVILKKLKYTQRTIKQPTMKSFGFVRE